MAEYTTLARSCIEIRIDIQDHREKSINYGPVRAWRHRVIFDPPT